MPFTAENYTPSRKHFLGSCWALVEMEHLTKRHQMTTQPELSIMSYFLSGYQTVRVGGPS